MAEAALQAQGKTVFRYKLWRALPTLAVQPLSLLLPGFIIHPSFVFLMLFQFPASSLLQEWAVTSAEHLPAPRGF